jgi:hypothetical protein
MSNARPSCRDIRGRSSCGQLFSFSDPLSDLNSSYELLTLGFSGTLGTMTAAKVIDDLMHLSREEQSRVMQFAFELARSRQLSGNELAALAQRMVDSEDPAEVERLKAEITRGFYGD